MSVDLEQLKLGSFTLTANLSDGSQWSDFYGHYGNDPAYAAGFANAVQDVQLIGVSFGGGCFFENGVGIKPGTGSGQFQLLDFTATP